MNYAAENIIWVYAFIQSDEESEKKKKVTDFLEGSYSIHVFRSF